MVLTTKSLRVRWVFCATLTSVIGLCFLSGGCPRVQPNEPNQPGGSAAQDGNDTGTGDATTGGSTGNTGTDGSTGTGGDGSTGNTGTDGSTGTGGDGSTGNTGTGGSTGTGGDGSTGGTTAPPPPSTITLSEVARTGGDVPGQPSGVTFTGFGNPVIDANGRVAFWATYAGSGALGTSGLFVLDGQLKVAVNDDPNSAGIVPGRPTPSYFGAKGTGYKPLENPLSWAGGDRLLFASDVTGTGQGATNTRGFYRWRTTDASIVRIADREQVFEFFSSYPGTFLNGFDQTFVLPGVSDAGHAVFGISYVYITQTTPPQIVSGQGVFTSNGTTLGMLADTVHSGKSPGSVPDQPADAAFSGISPTTTISPGADMLFQGAYTSSTAEGGGVYLGRNSSVYRVIDSRSGVTWPGLPAGAEIGSDQYGIAIGPAGHIAVDTTLTVNGTTHDTVLLWDWVAGTWGELTGSDGSVATALVSGVNDQGQAVILAGSKPHLVTRSGRVRMDATLPGSLQGATLTWAESGGSINNWGRAVVAYAHSDGSAGLAFWTSAQLLVVADVKLGTPVGVAAISTIVGPERDRPGRSGLLNDSDQLVFRAGLSGGAQAVYLARGQ